MYHIVFKFQSRTSNTSVDMIFDQVWILVKSRQTVRWTACTGGLKMTLFSLLHIILSEIWILVKFEFWSCPPHHPLSVPCELRARSVTPQTKVQCSYIVNTGRTHGSIHWGTLMIPWHTLIRYTAVYVQWINTLMDTGIGSALSKRECYGKKYPCGTTLSVIVR